MTADLQPMMIARNRPDLPWLFLIISLGAVILASIVKSSVGWFHFDSIPTTILAGQLVFTIVALSVSAIAVVNCAKSPIVLGTAALVVGTSTYSIPESWDTIIMAFGVTTAVAAFAAVLVASPRKARQWAFSLAILFHFGGIATAITSVPPPFGPAPWLSTQLWTRIYRPYFHFMYMYNAYHFYSPDPGPASVLWICLDYSDGSRQWCNLPNRNDHMKDPLALSYYRRLSLTESTNQLVQSTYVSPIAIEGRRLAGLQLGIPTPERIAELTPNSVQYRAPNEYSRRMLKSYARFLARNNPHANTEIQCTGVKIYRAYHTMLMPNQLAQGKDPSDPDTYLPYFQGEFDMDGRLKNPNDPFLYWLMPVLSVPRPPEPVRPDKPDMLPSPKNMTPTTDTINCLELHAYSTIWSNAP